MSLPALILSCKCVAACTQGRCPVQNLDSIGLDSLSGHDYDLSSLPSQAALSCPHELSAIGTSTTHSLAHSTTKLIHRYSDQGTPTIPSFQRRNTMPCRVCDCLDIFGVSRSVVQASPSQSSCESEVAYMHQVHAYLRSFPLPPYYYLLG